MHIPAALFVVLWMWFDLIGSLLSVISSYFYFGWEQVPLRVPKIFAIALLAFSAPFSYRLLLQRARPEQLSRVLTVLLFVLYLALALNRQSDFFAWGSVAAVWLGGLALLAILRSLHHVPLNGLTPYVLLMAVLFFLSTRISQGGLPLLLAAPGSAGFVAWGPLVVFGLAAVFLPTAAKLRAHTEAPIAEDSSTPLPRSAGSLGWVLGLLTGLSVGLIFNLHIWSAQDGSLSAAAWFLPLSLGALGAGLLYQSLPHHPRPLLAGAAVGMGLGLWQLLYVADGRLWLAMPAQALASAGLLVFWGWFFHLWRARLSTNPAFFPWLSLQGGCVGLLLILALFLLQANPGGFWLALGLSAVILIWQAPQVPAPLAVTGALRRLWLYSCGVFALMGLAVIVLPAPQVPTESAAASTQSLRVMTSNIRYGWTDDYRFEPQVHVNWLSEHLPDIMGLQEVNKGHTSGAYGDLFRYYQRQLKGQWYYGDAHYGFGNALFSRLPIDALEVRTYRAKDLLKRSCLVASARWQGRPIKIFVTHLSHLAPPNPVREDQLAELVGWLRETREPWLLLGDFNATPDMPEMQKLLPLAHPVFRERPELLATPSYPGLAPKVRIDYVWFSKDFALQSMDVLDNHGSSDHRPVVATLTLPTPK
ncbi:MAG: endonuclease/exonuclease/phosphatase family protein [Candidatus Sericytochromatia bacterium]